uniref:Uncharacterized protein n=1 Tax=Anguilla anguilla TaxID=7936 RepID=A0A0E9TP04_ANGAN
MCCASVCTAQTHGGRGNNVGGEPILCGFRFLKLGSLNRLHQ